MRVPLFIYSRLRPSSRHGGKEFLDKSWPCGALISVLVRWNRKESLRFIGWLASQIPDPILRLKFLMRFAPPPRRRGMMLCTRVAPAVLGACVTSFLFCGSFGHVPATPVRHVIAQAMAATPVSVQPVWPVDESSQSESWSNGLRIDNQYRVAGPPRSYIAFHVDDPADNTGVRRTDAAGIVFHTTESEQAPFEAQERDTLQRIGESLLAYVQRRAAYNFVIDRFGRVYRVVPEGQVSNHAGNSIWASDKWLYLNLNESFLGIAFEARTAPGQVESELTPAQARASSMLVEMLRARFGIPAANCVTHAQVSVNPTNMRIGYHTDWASAFPFEQSGLPDNYEQPPAAIWAAGFEYDAGFLNAAGPRIADALHLADGIVSRRAAALNIPVDQYRRALQKSYRERLSSARRVSG